MNVSGAVVDGKLYVSAGDKPWAGPRTSGPVRSCASRVAGDVYELQREASHRPRRAAGVLRRLDQREHLLARSRCKLGEVWVYQLDRARAGLRRAQVRQLLFVSMFTTLLAIINPLEALPHLPEAASAGGIWRRVLRVARLSCFYALLLMFFF